MMSDSGPMGQVFVAPAGTGALRRLLQLLQLRDSYCVLLSSRGRITPRPVLSLMDKTLYTRCWSGCQEVFETASIGLETHQL